MSYSTTSRALALVAGLTVGAVIVAGCGSSSSSGSSAASKALSNITSAEASASAAAGGGSGGGSSSSPQSPPITSGDWRLDSLTVSEETINDTFQADGKVTYVGSGTPSTAIFEVDIFKGGKQIGTLAGDGDYVGGQQSLDLLSSDTYQAGPYTFTFVPAGG